MFMRIFSLLFSEARVISSVISQFSTGISVGLVSSAAMGMLCPAVQREFSSLSAAVIFLRQIRSIVSITIGTANTNTSTRNDITPL